MASSHLKCDSGWGGWVLWLQGYIALAQDPHHFDHESSHTRTHYINTYYLKCMLVNPCEGASSLQKFQKSRSYTGYALLREQGPHPLRW